MEESGDCSETSVNIQDAWKLGPFFPLVERQLLASDADLLRVEAACWTREKYLPLLLFII